VSTDESNAYPVDLNGHGTHTLATAVGDDGAGDRVGVAPGARWIAVKIFNGSAQTYESWIHDAFEWLLAPEGDPALAPDVINASWGAPDGSLEFYRPDVAALRAAGIFPVFAAGNDGGGPETVGSPASYPESFAVGAVDEENRVAFFSSRGPSPWHEIKPEVVAPGTRIRSAFPGGGYAFGTGTSMAAPHVAGLAALLLQANPTLTIDALEALLTQSARPLSPEPDNNSGWGLVDAYAAALRVSASGELVGQVRRSDGSPIPYPLVTIVEKSAGEGGAASGISEVLETSEVYSATAATARQFRAIGDATGAFTVALRPGRYDVQAVAFGYAPATANGVAVRQANRTTIVLTATLRPLGVVFGRVTDATTGQPVGASVEVPGTPARVESDPATGAFSLALPPGTWELLVRDERHRLGHGRVRVTADESVERNFTLRPAPRILLVDSGRWYYRSQTRAYEQGLTELDYSFDLHRIRWPFGATSDVPTATQLLQYDLVIWSAPEDSPGLVGASYAISSFLSVGGRLLLSGQDVAYWDGGGTITMGPAAYMIQALGAYFLTERQPSVIVPVRGRPLDGLDLQLNTADSARNQASPDVLGILAPD
ncbi:MAG TPA: S8 family serine peptidase, partial [Ardenticatenaceae bacterium]|nr:S8 family serine peptidase [Ardenticatenaceae bacterium]